MNILLYIETATKVCSVALSKNDVLFDLLEFQDENYSHSEKLTVQIIELLKRNNLEINQLSAVVVSSGPGSYTGLRIGVSTAKGICYGANIPLISVNTLAALSEAIEVRVGTKFPMIDARRMEVYTAAYSPENNKIKEDYNLIVDTTSFESYQKPIYLIGNGAIKLKEIFKNSVDIIVRDDVFCSASYLMKLGYDKFLHQDFEDVAYFEPNYGKEFYTTMKLK